MAHPAELEAFPVVLRLPVLWGDQDAFGHVNNTLSFRWFESARIEYFAHGMIRAVMMRDSFGPILARIDCNFRRQIKFPDNVLIGASVTGLGRTSMQMAHTIYSEEQQAVVSEGDSTIVAFNYQSQEPHPLPDDMRSVLGQIEGKDLG